MKGFNFLKNAFAAASAGLGLALICGCHHGIDPDDLEYPPEVQDGGIATMDISKEDAEKDLKKISEVPYPPYKVQGGDVFRIKVYNEEDLDHAASSRSMVTPDGYLIMGLIDPVMIKNLTIVEATDKVRKELQRYIKYPHVSLVPEEIQGQTATLFGAVREPGSYNVTDKVRLADFVAMGKGYSSGILDNTTVDMADISSSYIIRSDKILPVNFTAALLQGDQLHNIKIFPQDIVYIAKKEDNRVIIMGEVKKPRTMNWTQNLTVAEAIASAGGLEEDYWGSVLILRKPKGAEIGAPLKVYKLDVDDLIAGKERNFRLASGDIVYVPKDSLGEYNVFIKKLMPTAQLINLLMTPPAYWLGNRAR